MTANRWWVRHAARWLARLDGVAPHLRLAMLALTGVSTATLTLRQYGHGEYAWPFIAAVSVGMVVYAYLYTEGGVWNQTSRDKTDLSDNYSGPTMLFDAKITARQLAYLGYALQNGEKTLGELDAEMQARTEAEWADLREGVDVAEIEAGEP